MQGACDEEAKKYLES